MSEALGALFFVFGVAIGILVLPASWLLGLPKCSSMVSGAIVSVVTLSFVLISFVTPYSRECLRLDLSLEDAVNIFPINILGAAGSWAGLAVAMSWARQQTSMSNLGIASLVYFASVSICNLCGVFGMLIMECGDNFDLGLPFRTVWIISSFATNLILQKIVIMRAALVDTSKMSKVLNCIFGTEVGVALLIVVGSVFTAIKDASAGDAREGGKNKELFYCLALLTLCFAIADLAFSVAATMAMMTGLQNIRKLIQAQSASQPNAEISRCVFFAKFNIALVLLSVTTTTISYFAFIAVSLALARESGESEAAAFFFSAWLVDSLFNDACVIFVGFGPTAHALKVVGAAASAEVVGQVIENQPDVKTKQLDSVVCGAIASPQVDGQSSNVDVGIPASNNLRQTELL